MCFSFAVRVRPHASQQQRRGGLVIVKCSGSFVRSPEARAGRFVKGSNHLSVRETGQVKQAGRAKKGAWGINHELCCAAAAGGGTGAALCAAATAVAAASMRARRAPKTRALRALNPPPQSKLPQSNQNQVQL